MYRRAQAQKPPPGFLYITFLGGEILREKKKLALFFKLEVKIAPPPDHEYVVLLEIDAEV